jgi:hypothetical protein
VQVHPSQRKLLQHYKAKAVAREAQLVARREQRLVDLKLEVARRIKARESKQVDKFKKLTANKQPYVNAWNESIGGVVTNCHYYMSTSS